MRRRLIRTIPLTAAFVLALWAVPAFPQAILYVDDDAPAGGDGTSWETAFKYLQDALAAATGGDQIRVAQGIYKPDQDEAGVVTPGDREATFQLISGVGLNGGYRGCPGGDWSGDPDERDIDAYVTTLRGDLLGDDGADFANYDENSYHVVTADGTDGTAALDGFTVTAGNCFESFGSDAELHQKCAPGGWLCRCGEAHRRGDRNHLRRRAGRG
jgi:hypothetical protein